jgi:hypothetical protein
MYLFIYFDMMSFIVLLFLCCPSEGSTGQSLMSMCEWLLTLFHPINFSHDKIHEKHFFKYKYTPTRVVRPLLPPPPLCPFPLAIMACQLLAL